VRFRQAIYLNPKSFLFKIISSRNISVSILGCNFSCFKKDMVAINGFDESYGETAIPDDMDWEWRFEASGVKLKSCKNVAIIYHLDHKIHDRGNPTTYLKLMYERKKNKQFICEEGLNTHVL
jgi:GT2 family glycosyltransferase